MERAEGRTTFVGVIKLDSSTRGWYTKSSSGSSEPLKTLRFGEAAKLPPSPPVKLNLQKNSSWLVAYPLPKTHAV